MRDLYHIRYSVIVVVVLLSSAFCSEDNRKRAERRPEGVDCDENYRIKVTRGQKVITSTFTRGGHYRDITLTVSAFNATFVLDLQLNTYLFSAGYVERSFNKGGVVYHDVNRTQCNCYYMGKVRDQPQSTAAVSTCKGIVGYFTVGNVSYHIDPASNQLNGLHNVYRGRDDSNTTYRCGLENVSFDSLMNPAMQHKRAKRFAWPQDLDKKNKVVELYVANDYSQFLSQGRDVNMVIERTKNIVNIASTGYQPLGIYIVLVGIEVWNLENKIIVNTSDSVSTLLEWAEYRTTYVNPFHYNDNGILITNNLFDNATVLGRAFVNTMCQNSKSASFVGDMYSLASYAGAVMDHEMGHNFGLRHDDQFTPCNCSDPGGKCLMAPIVNLSFKWSQCSLDQFAYSFEHGLDICLHNVPKTIQPGNTLCGNGILENDEQCDCGNSSNQECNHACCNRTCQLVYPATCAYGRCCNISSCQILSCGTLCRAKAEPGCDLDEFCDGHKHLCSDDTHLPDGANCNVNGVAAHCYNGLCRSHQSQCELLWGPGTLSSSFTTCYTLNNQDQGLYGDCGKIWLRGLNFITCVGSDVLCGTLQCQDFSRNLTYYLNSHVIYRPPYITDECHAIAFDFGLDTQDPGYVPSGASCGIGKMCVNQRCLDISSLNTTNCATCCQTNEVCNNLGQCQRTTGSCLQSTVNTTPTSCTDPTTTTTPVPTTTTPVPTKATSHVPTTTTTPRVPTTTTTPLPTTTPVPTTTTTTPHVPTTTTLVPTITLHVPTTTPNVPTRTTTPRVPTTTTPVPTTTSVPTTTATPHVPTTTPHVPTTTSTPTIPTTTPHVPTTTTTTTTTHVPTTTTPVPTTTPHVPTTTTTTHVPTTTTPVPATTTPVPTTTTTVSTKATPHVPITTTTPRVPTTTTALLPATTSVPTKITTPHVPTTTTPVPTTTPHVPTTTPHVPTTTTTPRVSTITTPLPTTTSVPTTTATPHVPTTTTPVPTTTTSVPTTTTPHVPTTTPYVPTTTSTPTIPTTTPHVPTTTTTHVPTTMSPVTTTTTTTTTTPHIPTTTPHVPTTTLHVPTTMSSVRTTTTPHVPTTAPHVPITTTPNVTTTRPHGPTTTTPHVPTTTPHVPTTTTPHVPTTTTPVTTTAFSVPTTTITTPHVPTTTTITTPVPTTTTTIHVRKTTRRTPVPTRTPHVPTATTTPVPTTTTTVPKTTTRISTTTTRVPTTSTPVKTSTTSVKTTSTHAPTTTTTPVSTLTTPSSTTSTVVPVTVTSVPATSITVPTKAVPGLSTLNPVPSTTTTHAPIPTTIAPTPTMTSSHSFSSVSTRTVNLLAAEVVLGIILGTVVISTSTVLLCFCCSKFFPLAFNSCCQLFVRKELMTSTLPAGSFASPAFSRGAPPLVHIRRRWIPVERVCLPQRAICPPPTPQTQCLQPDWSLLKRPACRQPLMRECHYKNVCAPYRQLCSSTYNKKIPQIVIR